MRFSVLAIIVLAACAPVSPAQKPGLDDQACGANTYQNLIGRSADVLAAMTFPAPMRVIRPGMAVTMDYSPERLNVDVDKRNIISRVWCG